MISYKMTHSHFIDSGYFLGRLLPEFQVDYVMQFRSKCHITDSLQVERYA